MKITLERIRTAGIGNPMRIIRQDGSVEAVYEPSAALFERSGIYKIGNRRTGDYYIGSANNVAERIRDHFQRLNSRIHGNKRLQDLFNRSSSGEIFSVILSFCTKREVPEMESRYLDVCFATAGCLNLSITPKSHSPLKDLRHREPEEPNNDGEIQMFWDI